MKYQLLRELTPGEYQGLKEKVQEAGGLDKPIIKDEDGNILDGHHRDRICKELGIAPRVEVRPGLTEEQKRQLVIRCNGTGRLLTKKERKELVKMKLMQNPERSDRQIAKETGLHNDTVSTMRKKLVSTGDVSESDTSTDTLGREQPRTRNRKPHPSDTSAGRMDICRRKIGSDLVDRCLKEGVPVRVVRHLHRASKEELDKLLETPNWKLREESVRLTWPYLSEYERSKLPEKNGSSEHPIWERDGVAWARNPNGDNRLRMIPVSFSYLTLKENARLIKQYLTEKETEVFIDALFKEDVQSYPDFGTWERKQPA